jgi:hypothetical protein
MAGNGKRRPPRPSIQIAATSASPDEAAAIAAALEQFLADTAPAPAPVETVSRWGRAALIEGVERAPGADIWGSQL